MKTPDDFWRKVTIGAVDECWPFTGGCNHARYGRVRYQRHRWIAHRLAWTLTNSPIPRDMFVLHRCDNPPCCNPAHLFLGTQTDNMQDMTAKGRGKFGERNGRAKLTSEDVRTMRHLYFAERKTQHELAKFFCVSLVSAKRIVNRKTWVTGVSYAE